jgi:polar amino acid transport system substrate-binding protein
MAPKRGLYKSGLLLFGLLLLPAAADAAGKCGRLVAASNPEVPAHLWRGPRIHSWSGANADLLQHLAKELGWWISSIRSWSRAQAEVKTGRIDRWVHSSH